VDTSLGVLSSEFFRYGWLTPSKTKKAQIMTKKFSDSLEMDVLALYSIIKTCEYCLSNKIGVFE